MRNTPKNMRKSYPIFLILVIALIFLITGFSEKGYAAREDVDQKENPSTFEVLYYNMRKNTGIVIDKKGVAVGKEEALFRVKISDKGVHNITFIEVYPENLPDPKLIVDSYPENIIEMLLKTYPKYNLPVRQ